MEEIAIEYFPDKDNIRSNEFKIWIFFIYNKWQKSRCF